HGTFLKVDEAGPEAAGSTAVVAILRGGGGDSVEFRADRPFLFFILHRPTRTVLFAGRVHRL
ncbi:MAG: serpin family protein, partial [Candidatus Eremiobacterota bacterium]